MLCRRSALADFWNSAARTFLSPSRWTARSKANSGLPPERVERSTSSRRCNSSSSRHSALVTPAEIISCRHRTMASSRLNIPFPPQTVKNRTNGVPLFAFGFQSVITTLLNAIIFALTPIRNFDPARFYPTFTLHPMQDRVKHTVGPRNVPLRQTLHLLNQFVSVALAL